VALRPEEIDSDLLPRASIGGFKPGPVAELLKRVAWDYRELLHANQQLHERLVELQDHAEELERQLEAHQLRKPPDELARQTLAASQRAARELRESTRQECEAALKKTRVRAKQIEREHARAMAELRELQALRRKMQERLRSSLNAALEHVDDSLSTATLEADSGAQLDATESAPRTSLQRQGQTQRV
jgi:cell division septum initiation protein DivIVA